jgi:hypothetical protein
MFRGMGLQTIPNYVYKYFIIIIVVWNNIYMGINIFIL